MAEEMNADREFDVIVWGATGFTGRLVAEYLVQRKAQVPLRLALAGRNQKKLEALRAELTKLDPSAEKVHLLLGDSYDRRSLDRMAARTKVICTTVGPYAKYGTQLVAACASSGTHYCDLTGEPQFIRRMIDSYHKPAEESGSYIVHCCGFDSIPSDLGTYMLHQAFAERGGQLKRCRFHLKTGKGGTSGGTIASMLQMAEEMQADPSVRKVVADPYALYPSGAARGLDKGDSPGIAHDADADTWTAPFIMATVNAKVVRRSNALLDFAYGRDFQYHEVVRTGRGLKGWLRAAAVAAGTFGLLLGVGLPPTRKLLAKRLPKPGEGPSREEREQGYFVCELIGDGVDAAGNPLQLYARVEGHGDPGYSETAKMLSESALCLAFDPLEAPGGVRTPASTMGQALLDRLRSAGMTFRVEGTKERAGARRDDRPRTGAAA